MTLSDAIILIDEAHKLGYYGTEWERAFISRIQQRPHGRLTSDESQSVQEFYRRATGGGQYERRHVIERKTGAYENF